MSAVTSPGSGKVSCFVHVGNGRVPGQFRKLVRVVAHRVLDEVGSLLALAPVRKRIDSVAIVDGIPVPTRDHRLAAPSYQVDDRPVMTDGGYQGNPEVTMPYRQSCDSPQGWCYELLGRLPWFAPFLRRVALLLVRFDIVDSKRTRDLAFRTKGTPPAHARPTLDHSLRGHRGNSHRQSPHQDPPTVWLQALAVVTAGAFRRKSECDNAQKAGTRNWLPAATAAIPSAACGRPGYIEHRHAIRENQFTRRVLGG